MASRSTNTMSEVLESIVTLLGTAKMMPDADIVWLTDLETQVIEKARAPFAQQGTMGPAPASTGGGGMGGGMAGAMAATPGGPGDGLAALLGGMGPGMPGPPNDPMAGGPGGPPVAPMTGMAGPGGGGRSMGGLGEVQRIMGAGPPRGARG